MQKCIVFFCLGLFLLVGHMNGQTKKTAHRVVLWGKLEDSLHKPLHTATIKLMKASDTVQAEYQLSNAAGNFYFPGVKADTYIVSIQFQGFRNLRKYISVDPVQDSLSLGRLELSSSFNEMETVSVTAVRPVTMNGDTTEFNADAFSVKPDATAGELLNKMSGIEVDKDGNIQSDGEAVPRIYVNGKPFFGDDPKMAIQNLPADAIKKIQVYDAQTDQSKFTGLDDAERIRTINIVTRRRFKGLFGRPSIAGGARDFHFNPKLYKVDGKAFLYGPEKQLAFIAKANNVVGPQVGNGHRYTLGTNYRNKIGEKSKISGSYTYNKNDNKQASKSWRTDLYTNDTVFNKYTERSSRNSNFQHKWSVDMETKFDSANELYIRPRYSIGNNKSSSASLTTIDSAYLDNVVHKNKTTNSSRSDNNQQNFSLSTTYNHRFKKKGRSVSLHLNVDNSQNDQERYSQTDLYDFIKDSLDISKRQFLNNGQHESYRANLDFTEVLGTRHMLQLELNASYSKNTSDQQVHNYDSTTEQYSIIDTALTNYFINTYKTARSTLSYRYHSDFIRLSIGTGLQWGKVKSKNNSKQTDLHQNYVNLYPTASFTYRFNKWRRLRFRYRGRTSQPDINQMQPIRDNSNPLYIHEGNPDLKQRFNHQVSIDYRNRDSATNKSINARLKVNVASNSIVNAVQRLDNGGQFSKPVNINGNYSINGYFSIGLPVRFIRSNLDLQTRVNHEHQVSLIDNIKNYTTKMELSETFRWRTNLDKLFDINFSTRPTYNIIHYSVSKHTNGNYFDQRFSFDGTWYTESGWESSASLHYTLYAGLPEEQQNNSTILNISFAKSLFHKAAKLTFSVTDLLDQSNGIDFTRTDNYIQQSITDVFNRYFLLSFSYNLRHLKFNNNHS